MNNTYTHTHTHTRARARPCCSMYLYYTAVLGVHISTHIYIYMYTHICTYAYISIRTHVLVPMEAAATPLRAAPAEGFIGSTREPEQHAEDDLRHDEVRLWQAVLGAFPKAP